MGEFLNYSKINDAQQYVNDVKGMSGQLFGKEVGITPGEYIKRLLNGGKGTFNRLMDKFTGADENLRHDDNICVPVGQKTLLGQDFQSLFNRSTKFSMTTMTTDTGQPKKYIGANTNYDVNMYGGLSKTEPVEYDALTPDAKAVYEVTLLSKAYASEMGKGNDDVLSQSYKSMMQAYQSVCENSGVSWAHVLNCVSDELQAENVAAKNRGDIDEFNAASNAHRMMLTAAPADFQDSLSIAYAGQFNYEDTINPNGDTSVDRSFLKSVGNLVQTGTSFASRIVGTAWNYCRSVASEIHDKIEFSGSNNVFAGAGKAATGFISESKAPQWQADMSQSRIDQADELLPGSMQSGSDEAYTM